MLWSLASAYTASPPLDYAADAPNDAPDVSALSSNSQVVVTNERERRERGHRTHDREPRVGLERD